ncbi:MAG: hypothetical protein U5Q44_02285 [Dehalococcoidia bacterium]|nr:hypothetical protein [Dehalococcoidia bacterium]
MLVFQRYTWWLGAMVGLALLLAVAGQVGALGPVQGLFVRVTSPVESALSGVFQPVATLLSDAGRLRSLEEENSELRLEVEALRNENTQLRQDAAEVEALREALNVVGANGGPELRGGERGFA